MIRVRDGKKLTHEGIKVEFVGSIGKCFITLTVFCVLYRCTQIVLKNYFMTADTTMNFCRYRRSSRHLGRCARHNRMISISKM